LAVVAALFAVLFAICATTVVVRYLSISDEPGSGASAVAGQAWRPQR
jgi:hypothetical protein